MREWNEGEEAFHDRLGRLIVRAVVPLRLPPQRAMLYVEMAGGAKFWVEAGAIAKAPPVAKPKAPQQ